MADVVRSVVPQRSKYGDYKEELRWDFWYSCCYCTMTEIEGLGSTWEIDHYDPLKGGTAATRAEKNQYANLVWACEFCNRRKSNIWPTPAQRMAGVDFFRPDLHAFWDHFRVSGNRIEGASSVGVFTDKVLRLNRRALLDIREVRARIAGNDRDLAAGMRQIRSISIDQLAPKTRAAFLEIRQSLLAQREWLQDSLSEDARRLFRAPQVDSEDARARLEANKERRQFLDSLGAKTVDVDMLTETS